VETDHLEEAVKEGEAQEDKMKNSILRIVIAISTIGANAQNEVDALRYSTQNLSGTARFSAMGGAFGSLGGEFSALSSNPAGIGMYQISEVTFSPSFNLNATKSYYNDTHLSSYKSELSIGNLGLVFTIPQNNPNWKRINFGIGWNQLANYNNTITIEGSNNKNSIVDRILEITNGTLKEELENGEGNTFSQMAWNTYLIDPLFNNNILVNGEYVSNFSPNPKSQSKVTRSIGGMNEFVFSIGGSYEEKLYIGATIGVPTIDYYEYSEYTEREISDTSNNLRRMLFSEEISAYGTGYNLKIGAIYRLSERIKIGGSLHTPTFLTIEEDYNTSITTSFKDSTLDYSMGYLNPFKYNLITPLKASIGASTIFNNVLISGEYELIDYSTAKYLTADFEDENLTIANIYQRTENIRIGAEMTIKPFILRAGYAKYGSAFITQDFSKEDFSYGVGINNNAYFIDVAYILSQSANEHLLYSENHISPISLVNTNHSLLFTLGFRY
tara:strand:- start:301 stop:1797 length:1497 start_codon:yes stop_codon:yes gene_type:complete